SGLRTLLGEREAQVLVFSCLNDKPVTELAQILFPLFPHVVLAPLHAMRATSMEDLAAAALATGTSYVIADSVTDAMERAEEQACGGTVVVSGSVYLVGEARGWLRNEAEA